MPVPTLVTDLSTTAASNSPAGSDNVFPSLDDYLRSLSGFIASIRDNSGNGWVSPYLPLTYSAGTANGVVYLNGSKVVTTGSALVFDGTNLGIGTSSPATTLHVQSATGQARIQNTTSGTALIGFRNSATTDIPWVGTGGDDLRFTTVSNERMRLDSSGNLGIGIAPVAGVKLQVKAATNQNFGVISQGGLTTISGFTDAGASAQLRVTGSTLSFSGDGTNEHARITSGGDLLVGDTNNALSTRLHVLATNNAFDATNTTSTSFTAVAWNQGTTGDNKFYEFATEATYTARGSIDYNRAGGLTRYNTTSDYRAKDIIGPLTNTGATIDALKVYEGVMKGATQSRPMLIAHEAQEHAPYAVSGVKDEVNEDGTPKFQQMDVSSLVPLLLAEIQSLRARVAALEAA